MKFETKTKNTTNNLEMQNADEIIFPEVSSQLDMVQLEEQILAYWEQKG